jgi:hypothetical protein
MPLLFTHACWGMCQLADAALTARRLASTSCECRQCPVHLHMDMLFSFVCLPLLRQYTITTTRGPKKECCSGWRSHLKSVDKHLECLPELVAEVSSPCSHLHKPCDVHSYAGGHQRVVLEMFQPGQALIRDCHDATVRLDRAERVVGSPAARSFSQSR